MITHFVQTTTDIYENNQLIPFSFSNNLRGKLNIPYSGVKHSLSKKYFWTV